jgi:multicomponent Na+:H+ antiporter subunit F
MSWDSLASTFEPVNVTYVLLSTATFCAFYRLARGPTLPDRVIALDLLALLAVGIAAAYAIDTEQRVFLDVAIVVALISFLVTVAFARYLEKGA